MLDQIVTQNAVQFNPAQRAAAQARSSTVMLNIRGVVCAVPRSQCSLEHVQDVEQARDYFAAVCQDDQTGQNYAEAYEGAFAALQNAILRNYDFESQLIARYRVSHVIKGVAFLTND